MPIGDLFGLLRKRQTTPDKYLASSVNVVGAGQHGAKRADFSQQRGISSFRSWVYAAASINANAVAATPLRLYSAKDEIGRVSSRSVSRHRKAYLFGDGPGDQRPSTAVLRKSAMYGDDMQEVVDHPILDLLNSANPYLNGFDLSVLRVLYGELTGNAYLHPVIDEASGVPIELWPLAPQHVEVIPDEDTFLRGYVYGVDAQHKQIFEPDEVIHFRRPNPGNLFYGMGKVEAAFGVIASNEALHQMDLSTFQNSARPDYAVVVKGTPTGDQLDRFQQQVEQRLRGTRKDGNFITVTGDVQFTPLNFPPKDIAGREEIVEEIAAVFGVPVSMLKANDPNLASAQTGFAQWREGTVLPLVRMDEQELNQRLLGMFGLGDDYCLAYDNPVPSDLAFELQERQTAVAGGWRTPNEARLEEGREPVENEFADQLLVNGQPLGGAAPVDSGFDLGSMPMIEEPDPAIPEPEEVEAAPTIEAAPAAESQAPLNGAQISSVLLILDGVAGGSVSEEAAIELISASGMSREAAVIMVSGQDDARPALAVETDIESGVDPTEGEKKMEPIAMASSVLGLFRSGTIESLTAIKSIQKCGFTRAVAERMIEGEKKSIEKIASSCGDESCGCETKAIDDVDLQPTEEMAELAERGLRLREEHGRGGTEVGVARARDISNRSNLSPETISRMSSFFARHRVDLDAPAADPGHDEYPSAGVVAWLLWGGDPANPDEAGAAWADRKVAEIEGESEKVYEWPKSVRKYRLGIEGLSSDFARVKAEQGEPSADEDIREDEKQTPAMEISSTVSDGLAEVQKTLIAAIESGEIASVPGKADDKRRDVQVRKILKTLAGLEGKILDDLVASISKAAAGGGSAGIARVNELLSGAGSGKVGSPAVSEALAKAIQKRAGLIAKAVVQDTVKRFVGSLDLTFSIQGEVARLQSLGDLSPSRAETIARTESANAYHEGQIDAWKESGAVREKHFLKAPGACPFCDAVEKRYGEKAKALAVDAPMVRGGETITANGKTLTPKFDSPGIVHPNCRCDFIPVIEGL